LPGTPTAPPPGARRSVPLDHLFLRVEQEVDDAAMVSSTVLMIVRPPGLPVTMNSCPSFARIVGVMLDSIRLPGSARFGFVPISPSALRRSLRGAC